MTHKIQARRTSAILIVLAGAWASAPGLAQAEVVADTGSPVAVVRAPDDVQLSPVALARALQTQLKRVGCYAGPASGDWNSESRAAMRYFNEAVNARLPVDKPDDVLLSLVSGHKGTVCNGQQTAAVEPSAAVAKVSAEPSRSVVKFYPETVPAPGAELETGSINAAAPEAEAVPSLPKAQQSQSLVRRATAAPARQHSQARRAELRPIHSKPKPPKIVRWIIRDVKNGLASIGF